MYGMIFDFLREYVEERHGGRETWNALLKANHKEYKIYFPSIEYPDREIVALAVTAANTLRLPLSAVLEDFGAFLATRLLSFYHMYINNDRWRSFEVIENAGGCIHHAINRHNPNRKPPKLITNRDAEGLMLLQYQSHRKLCHVVKGIVRGLGDHFHEKITITETQCMLDGADSCIMHLERQEISRPTKKSRQPVGEAVN
ncbi:MAG: heme NO-binding domain-containing protein [Gammaproteobacteria bacterium]|nr:heme NO-binding domain-containing protein [Gammaproteobacteria bacterium]MDH5802678.1 heme NO-binding domain-containing protein [Gammaproteobacteria bacterium]